MNTITKFEVGINREMLREKPVGDSKRRIMANISRNFKRELIDISEFAHCIGTDGCSFSHLYKENPSNEGFQGTHLVCLDFDDDKRGLPDLDYDDFLTVCSKNKLNPLFTYKTLSCSDTKINRFRAVFASSKLLNEIEYRNLSNYLFNIFSAKDKCSLKVSQWYLGGKGIINDWGADYTDLSGLTDSMSVEDGVCVKFVKSGNSHLLVDNVTYHFLQNEPSNQQYTQDNCQENGITDLFTLDEQYIQVQDFTLFDGCSIYKDVINGVPVDYYERLQLFSAFAFIKDGVKHLCNFLPADKAKAMAGRARHWKKTYKNCLNCKSCPRYEKCTSRQFNLFGFIRKESNVPRVISDITVDDGFDILNENLKLAFGNENLTIIKAPTGIGKTEALVRNATVGTIYCFPTHEMKDEFIKRFNEVNPDLFTTESLPLPISALTEGVMTVDGIQRILAKKNFRQMAMVLNQHGAFPAVRAYQENKKHIKNLDANEILVTTHAQLPYLLGLYPERKFIIDENPEQVLFKTDTINKSVFVEEMECEDIFSNKVGEVNKTPDYEVFSKNNAIKLFQKSDYYIISKIENPAVTDIKQFSISYITHLKNNLNNCIILSATIDIDTYKLQYPELIAYNMPVIALKGRVIQHNDATYSKSYCKKNKARIEQIRASHGGSEIFTHYDKSSGEKFHLRNLSGIDKWKGKDLCIIGTSFPSPVRTQLMGAVINKEIITDTIMRVRRIVKNDGRIFRFFTYRNETLRTLHLGEIEEVSMQAVGRARLLREDATVHLYSDYILSGVVLASPKQEVSVPLVQDVAPASLFNDFSVPLVQEHAGYDVPESLFNSVFVTPVLQNRDRFLTLSPLEELIL